MAYFSLTDLMFGDHGIAYIPDVIPADRARILSHVARQLVEQGHHFGVGDEALSNEEIGQAIDKAKREICGIFGSGNIGHNHARIRSAVKRKYPNIGKGK